MMETGKITETKPFKVTHATRGPTAVPHYRFTPEALTALGLTEERP
jgi:hypothetical protein